MGSAPRRTPAVRGVPVEDRPSHPDRAAHAPRLTRPMNAATSITVTPVHVADLLADGNVMPVYVHVIDHPEGRARVDRGMTEPPPLVPNRDPRLDPLSEQDFALAGIDLVVNPPLPFAPWGGTRLFAGKPI